VGLTSALARIASTVLIVLVIKALCPRPSSAGWPVLLIGALFYYAEAGAQAPVIALTVLVAGIDHSPVLLALLMALVFAVFEESSRWIAFLATGTMQRHRQWSSAMVYGAGHGGAQALRFIFLGAALPALASRSLGGTSYLLQLAISLHRSPAIAVHCGLSVLAMYGVLTDRKRFLPIAIAAHAAVDAVWLVLLAADQLVAADSFLIAAALASLGIAIRLSRMWPEHRETLRAPSAAGLGIRTHHLVHVYNANNPAQTVRALDGIDLHVEPGQLLALLGHNGAGKTTTLRILGGLLSPTAGEVAVAGFDAVHAPAEVRKMVGLQSEEPGLYRHMKVSSYLNFFGKLYDIPSAERAERINRLLARLELGHKRSAPGGSLSKGNKQKVALARTLIHKPEVVLLDEPTSGLDPAVSLLVRELISELRAQGRTILLATHNLYEAQTLADQVAIVHRGRVIRQGSMHELQDTNGAGKHFVLRIAAPHGDLEPLIERLNALATIIDVSLIGDSDRGGGSDISFSTPSPAEANPSVLATALSMGFKPYSLSESAASLEQLYLGIDRELARELAGDPGANVEERS
jgi:ABC-2 type transport system ATP-binding protein